jgi:hypothetical protein
VTVLLVFLLLALPKTANADAHQHPQLWAWYRSSGARCIHGYEGSWTDPGWPYYGGFQMDITFQQRWAPRRLAVSGTADHWRPFRQVLVMRRAVRAIGWSPWPNTARYCGLL